MHATGSYWCHRMLSSLRDLPIGTAADPFMGKLVSISLNIDSDQSHG